MGSFVAFLFQYVELEKAPRDILRMLLMISLGVLVPAIGIGVVVNQRLPFDLSFFIAWQIMLVVVVVDLVAIRKYRRAWQVLGIIGVGLVMVAAFVYWGRTEWSHLNLVVTCAQFYLGVRASRYDF